MPLTLSFAFFKNGLMNFFNTTSSLMAVEVGVGISLGFGKYNTT